MDLNATDDDALNPPPMPIAEDAVELRVNPDISWPEELEGEGADWAWSARQSFDAASNAFASYLAARDANARNKHLTPEGARAADAEWVEETLPTLQKRAEKLHDESKRLDEQLQRMADAALKAPESDDEGIKPAEVRQWLLAIPERERADRALSLIRQGDKTVLRTVLCTPTWMTGVPPEEIEALREDVIQASDPVRYKKIRAVQKGIVAAERAVEGTMRFLQQDVGPDGHLHRSPSRPGLRRVG